MHRVHAFIVFVSLDKLSSLFLHSCESNLNSIYRSILQNRQVYLKEVLSIPETISNFKVSHNPRKLTLKLPPVLESPPVAMLETDNSTSFSFTRCAFRIFCPVTSARFHKGIECLDHTSSIDSLTIYRYI